jgi:hypothetical protein
VPDQRHRDARPLGEQRTNERDERPGAGPGRVLPDRVEVQSRRRQVSQPGHHRDPRGRFHGAHPGVQRPRLHGRGAPGDAAEPAVEVGEPGADTGNQDGHPGGGVQVADRLDGRAAALVVREEVAPGGGEIRC